MTDGMAHDDARRALDALALDALDASERMAILAHVRDCPECREELALLERTASELSYAAAPIAMSPAQRARVRARLLARASADERARGRATPEVVTITSARATRRVHDARGMQWLAAAAVVVALASSVLLARTWRERDGLRDALRVASAEQGRRAAALDSLQVAMADRDRMIATLTGPSVAVMTLASTSPASPSARMFWDQAHDAWVFVAHGLGRPKAGRTYQLWLVTPTSKISAGTFAPAANGDAMVRATYALPAGSLAAVAVTDEPAAGSEQPTTAPIMVATAKAGN